MDFLTNLNLTGNELQNAKMHLLSSAPASPTKGRIYFNTVNNRLWYYNGTEWVGADAVGATMTGANIVSAINASASVIDDDNLSSAVNDALAKAHNTHSISNVTGLQTALDGKAPVVHTHAISDTTGLQTALDGKSATTHNHTLDELSNTTITSNTAGEILKWSGTAWVNNTLAEAGIATSGHTHSTYDRASAVLSGADVFSNLIITDGIVTGSATRALSPADIGASASTHNHTLDSLSNTTITSNTSGEILKWNGTAWINNTLAEAGISEVGHTHTIANVTGLQTALDGKVDDSQVLTNVPAGAVFTDTVTTINGKTGVITKADIVALGIPAQDTTYAVFTTTTNGLVPMSDGSTSKYLRADGTWVVPPNTIYTLPVAGASLGGVKSGTDITVDASGNVTVNDDSHNHVISNVDGLQTALDGKETPAGATAKASTAEVNAKSYADGLITNLLGSAPSALDTLNELATALGNDANFATTITNQINLRTKKYVTAIGDATNTSFVITHNLNTQDIAVTIRLTASPFAQVVTDVEFTTVNTATVKFAVAPSLNQYTITLVG